MDRNADLLTQLGAIDARSRWPKKTGEWARRDLADIQGVVLHQTGGGADIDALHAYHTGPNHMASAGLPGIAYSLFIDGEGVISLVNDLEARTWSQGTLLEPGDENRHFVAVCVGGRFWPWPGTTVDARPSPTVLASVERTWEVLAKLFGLSPLGLFGHYHWGKPACPGAEISKFIERTRKTAGDTLTTPASLQRALNKLGAELVVDGRMGPKTLAALHHFQQAHRLPTTDVVTKLTAAALHRAITVALTPS
jgi:hypothetical protein